MSRNMRFQPHNNFVYYRLFQRAPLQTDMSRNMNMRFQPHNNWMYNMLFLLDYPQMDMSRNMNMMMMLHILAKSNNIHHHHLLRIIHVFESQLATEYLIP